MDQHGNKTKTDSDPFLSNRDQMVTTGKVTKGHLKVKLVAGNWPLILVAIETIVDFEGLVTEIRDDNLRLVWN